MFSLALKADRVEQCLSAYGLLVSKCLWSLSISKCLRSPSVSKSIRSLSVSV